MKKVMFVCKRNSCRSQMAEGFAKKLAKGLLQVDSCGIEASRVHPTAVQVMSEVGVDITNQESNDLNQFKAQDYDAVISLCGCGVNLPEDWVTQEVFDDWLVDDPDGKDLQAFYQARDEIKQKVENLIQEMH